MSRITSPLCALALALAAGCGGGSSNYHIPTGTELKPFQAPESEELLGDEDDAWDLAAEDLEEEGDVDDSEPAAAPAGNAAAMPEGGEAAQPPATEGAKPAAKPAKPAKTPPN